MKTERIKDMKNHQKTTVEGLPSKMKLDPATHQAPSSLIEALDRIQVLAEDSGLSEEYWTSCAPEFDYIHSRIGLSREEALIVAVLCEKGEPMSWRCFGEFFGTSRLRIMSMTPHMESLKKRRWIVSYGVHTMTTHCQGFRLVYGVVTAMREDRDFEPPRIHGLTEQQFVDYFMRLRANEGCDSEMDGPETNRLFLELLAANPQLLIHKHLMELEEDSSRIIMLLAIANHVRYAGRAEACLQVRDIYSWYGRSQEISDVCDSLIDGSHELFETGLIEHGCADGLLDPEMLCLTAYARETLIGSYNIRSALPSRSHRDMIPAAGIKPKELYFNSAESRQIKRLESLLSPAKLHDIHERLQQKGMRKGIACLFYGAPGTGKTETVMQLARQTGRDVMQVDIAAMRDKFVGESEKNIKAVFQRYKRMCRDSKATPILLFNEADAIFGNRFESVRSSVEKMDNAMQNIILQEIENLEGILIATTNLTGNLDRAFDRRFLFKVEFSRPEADTRRLIWRSMMPDLPEADAKSLAAEFELSGGQIENVARKSSIEWILSGDTPGLDTLREFCREERLNRSARNRIGF